MMLKRIFSVILLCCFLNLILTVSFALAITDEEQAERDAEVGRVVLCLVGIALLTYIAEHAPKFTSEKTITFLQKSKNQIIDFEFNFFRSDMMPDRNNDSPMQPYDEILAPSLKLIVRF